MQTDDDDNQDMSNYLTGFVRAEDVPVGYREQHRIMAVASQKFDDGTKPILYLSGFSGRPFCMNQTNLKALLGAFGPFSKDWAGQTVTLVRTVADFKGKSVPALRLEIERRPAVAAPAAQPRIGKATTAPAVQTPSSTPVTPTPRLAAATIASALVDDYPEGHGGAPLDDDIPL